MRVVHGLRSAHLRHPRNGGNYPEKWMSHFTRWVTYWLVFVPSVFLISVASTFLGLFIAVAVSEVFEAQTFSNFFRFPMLFLCGLFFPISALPYMAA